MRVQELEDKVWTQDGIRIVVRAASAAEVRQYAHKKAAEVNWRVTEFLEKRINPLLDGKEVIVLEGNGEQPNGNSRLGSIRQSYGR